jgi:hypothetical protein
MNSDGGQVYAVESNKVDLAFYCLPFVFAISVDVPFLLAIVASACFHKNRDTKEAQNEEKSDFALSVVCKRKDQVEELRQDHVVLPTN